MLFSKVSSGLDFLDASSGGIFSNRCYLLRGPSGSGRTTASLQFLLSALNNNENALMITSNRIENVILKAESIGLPLDKYLVDNRLILMEYPKEIIDGHFQFSHIIRMLGEIERYREHYGCTRIVFDTIIPLLNKAQNSNLVNYIYSLINSLEALGSTILAVVGEPNSPSAQRITQLLEDAVVGSFVLSKLTTGSEVNRLFAIHKNVDKIVPPRSFKIDIEHGKGIVLQSGKAKAPKLAVQTEVNPRLIYDLPMQFAVIDNDLALLNQLEEIFNSDCQIAVFDSIAEFEEKINDMEIDFILLNTSLKTVNWREFITRVRRMLPKVPQFLVHDKNSDPLPFRVIHQAGGDGLFEKPLNPNDLVGALLKSFKKYDVLEELIAKRQRYLEISELPDDVENGSAFSSQQDDAAYDSLMSPQAFRDKLNNLIWRSKQNDTVFSLVSFKMVYISGYANQDEMPQGLELVQKVAGVVQHSLRGAEDTAVRYMDKVIAMLEESDKLGAKAFARRVAEDIGKELSRKLRLQVGRHINVLTAVVSYPEDGGDVDTLMYQATDAASNFVKSAH